MLIGNNFHVKKRINIDARTLKPSLNSLASRSFLHFLLELAVFVMALRAEEADHEVVLD